MTNIKGMDHYVASAAKATPAQKDSSVNSGENGGSFENQLNDAVNSTAGKDTQGKKPVKDSEENVKETKGQDKLPAEGFLLTDITVPVLTDDGKAVDLLRGLTERSAAVVVSGYGEATPVPTNSLPTNPVQQTEAPVIGEEVQHAFAKTDAAVKELTGQRDAAVTKTDTSGFGMQQVDTKQSGMQRIDAEQTGVQQVEVKHQDVQQAETKQPGVQQAETKQPGVRQTEVKQSEVKQPEVKQPDTTQVMGQQTDSKQLQNSDTQRSGVQQLLQEQQNGRPVVPESNMNQAREKSAGFLQGQAEAQPQPQAQLQQQTAGKPQNDSLIKADTESITVTGQREQPADTKKTGEPTEVYQDVSAVKQNRLEPETPVRIKVAEPYKALDTDAVKQLAARISEGAAKGNKELIIQLTPENLGRISIKIATEADGVKVILSCENQKTLGLLSDKATGISHIVENNLNQHAVVEIKEDGYWNQQKNATDQHTGQQGRQQEEQNSGNDQQDDMDNFIQQLRLGMHTGEIAV